MFNACTSLPSAPTVEHPAQHNSTYPHSLDFSVTYQRWVLAASSGTGCGVAPSAGADCARLRASPY